MGALGKRVLSEVAFWVILLSYNRLVAPRWFLHTARLLKRVENRSSCIAHVPGRRHVWHSSLDNLKTTFDRNRPLLTTRIRCRILTLATRKPICTPCSHILHGALTSLNLRHLLVLHGLYVLTG